MHTQFLFAAWHTLSTFLCFVFMVILGVALSGVIEDILALQILGGLLTLFLVGFLMSLRRSIAVLQFRGRRLILRTGLWISPRVIDAAAPRVKLSFSKVDDTQAQGPMIEEKSFITRSLGACVRLVAAVFLRPGLNRKSGLETFVHLRIQSDTLAEQVILLPDVYRWNSSAYEKTLKWLHQHEISFETSENFKWKDLDVMRSGFAAAALSAAILLIPLVRINLLHHKILELYISAHNDLGLRRLNDSITLLNELSIFWARLSDVNGPPSLPIQFFSRQPLLFSL